MPTNARPMAVLFLSRLHRYLPKRCVALNLLKYLYVPVKKGCELPSTGYVFRQEFGVSGVLFSSMQSAFYNSGAEL